jgi:AraC family transcriptional regulator of adaptative response/methylated-DNA-[protein]-cysteine methyltransferase
MIKPALPPESRMWQAFETRDASFDGVFVTAVRTTGIFCRPSCSAKKPRRENVVFMATAREALFQGYRACLRCRPLDPPGAPPEWIRPLLEALAAEPARRWRDADLRARGLDPDRVRRWFARAYDMTFHQYQRALRVGGAIRHLSNGGDVLNAAYEHGWESLSAFDDALRALTGRSPARSRDATVIHLARIDTPLGVLLAAACERALRLLEFTDRRMLETQLQRLEKRTGAVLVPGDNDVIARTRAELDAYFRGELRDFTVPLEPAGTQFQVEVWQELRRIAYGETRSYGAQASALGRRDTVRAVARANGDNPIAIIVPCHRVVGSDGSLTGYGGGLWRKQRLLDLEQGVASLPL